MIDENKLIERLQRCVDTSDNSNFKNGVLSAIGIVFHEKMLQENNFPTPEDTIDLNLPNWEDRKINCISAVTIGKLIEAHMEHDEKKFISYANFIAEAYEQQGEDRKARIIRKRLDGTYKNDPQVTLDSEFS